MAFGADCGASTVLEESRVARTVGSLVPGVCRVKNSKFEHDASLAAAGSS